jgi:HK97 gp10 family phage protein
MARKVSRVDASDAISGLDKIKEMTAKAKGKAIEKSLKEIVQEARARARVDTGAMRDSITYWVEGSPVDSGYAECTVPYAAYQEFGTRYISPNYFMTGAFQKVIPRLPSSVADVIRGEVTRG